MAVVYHKIGKKNSIADLPDGVHDLIPFTAPPVREIRQSVSRFIGV